MSPKLAHRTKDDEYNSLNPILVCDALRIINEKDGFSPVQKRIIAKEVSMPFKEFMRYVVWLIEQENI